MGLTEQAAILTQGCSDTDTAQTEVGTFLQFRTPSREEVFERCLWRVSHAPCIDGSADRVDCLNYLTGIASFFNVFFLFSSFEYFQLGANDFLSFVLFCFFLLKTLWHLVCKSSMHREESFFNDTSFSSAEWSVPRNQGWEVIFWKQSNNLKTTIKCSVQIWYMCQQQPENSKWNVLPLWRYS